MANFDRIEAFKPCRLYIGNGASARRNVVEKLKLTHVVHCVGFFEKNAYSRLHVEELLIPVADVPTENIMKHFPRVCSFLDKAIPAMPSTPSTQPTPTSTVADDSPPLSSALPGGRVQDNSLPRRPAVLIHCAVGRSRSVSLTCAYLMHRFRKPFRYTLGRVRQSRRIACPNDGFRVQLQFFEEVEFDLRRCYRLDRDLRMKMREADRGMNVGSTVRSLANRLSQPRSRQRAGGGRRSRSRRRNVREEEQTPDDDDDDDTEGIVVETEDERIEEEGEEILEVPVVAEEDMNQEEEVSTPQPTPNPTITQQSRRRRERRRRSRMLREEIITIEEDAKPGRGRRMRMRRRRVESERRTTRGRSRRRGRGGFTQSSRMRH